MTLSESLVTVMYIPKKNAKTASQSFIAAEDVQQIPIISTAPFMMLTT